MKIFLFPEMQKREKYSPRRSQIHFFLSIYFNFLNKVYTQRTTLTALFFVEKPRVLPFSVRKEKNVNSFE